jgi:hypothetical protein
MPRPEASQRRSTAQVFWALSAVFAISALVPAAQLARLPELCLLKRAGLPCWGCGLSRGFCALSHGDWDAALRYNPLTPFVYAALWGLWSHAAWRLLQRPAARRGPA